jgi:hypothetical protein
VFDLDQGLAFVILNCGGQAKASELLLIEQMVRCKANRKQQLDNNPNCHNSFHTPDLTHQLGLAVFRQWFRRPQLCPANLQASLRQSGLHQSGLHQSGLHQSGLRQSGLRHSGLRYVGLRYAGLR